MSAQPRPEPHPIDVDRITTRQEFAAALTRLRERAGLTVRQVAKDAGQPDSTVGGYFSGRHLPPPSPADLLADLLRACGVVDESVVESWRRALLRVRRAPGPRPAGAPAPYRGLAAFQPEDAAWFHGREELTSRLLARLARRHAEGDGMLVVVGPSGSGKSSLLRAGLVPAVRAGELPVPGSRSWPPVLLTPGNDPVARLAGALAPAAGEGGLVVVVDQLEELFTADLGEPARAEFVAALGRLATGTGRSTPALVVLGLRADFYGHALAHPPLAAALQDAQLVVGPMSDAQLRRVIVEPARRAQVDVDEGLIEVLLRDVAPATGDPPSGALPLLSHALLVTWELGQGRRLTLSDYRDSGGLRGAVAKTAERVYGELTGPEREQARRLFLRLVRVSPDGADTARRVPRDELHAPPAVLERFITSRLLTADLTTVQISHEALLYAWPRLRGWIDADRAGLVTGQRLVEAAEAWERERRDPAALYRGSRLAAARDRTVGGDRELPPLVGEFLAASASRERRGVRRLYQTIAALLVLLAMAVTAGVVAVGQRSHALAQERFATAERDQAISRLVAGRADRIRDEDVSLAAQLSLAAYRIWPTPEARAALIDSSAAHTATRLLGSTGVMQSVAFSPDHRILAAGTADRTVLRWDLSDPDHPTQLVPPLTGPADIVYAVAFSPDGGTLAAAAGDRKVHLWDVADPARPRPLDPLTGPTELLYSVTFSPDGRTLAAGSADRRVHLWDLADPRRPAPLPPLARAGGYVQAVAFSPDGTVLAAGHDDATVQLWDLADPGRPAPLGEPLAGPERTVFAVAFHPDGQTLAAGSADGNAYLWDLADPARPRPLDPPLAGASGWVQSVEFGPDGDTLAAASSGEAWLWDWRAGRVTAILPHPGPVTSLVYGADRHTLVTAAADGTARRWRLPGPALRGDDVPINNLRFDPAGEVLAVASGETRLWSVTGRVPLSPPITNPTGFSGAVAFAAPGDALFVSDRAGTLRAWDLTDPARPARLGSPVEAHPLLVEQMALSPDGTVLATGGDDNLVRLWDVTDPAAPALRAELDGFAAYVYSVRFNHGGDLLAAASVDNSVRLWNVRDPDDPSELTEPLVASEHYALSLAFHPDDTVLAVGSADRNIYLWDISDPRRPARRGGPLVGADNYVYALAYSPDGRTLAAANTDQTVRLWDVAEPHRPPAALATLTVPEGPLYTVAYSPDGRTLAAGGGGNTVWLWDTRPDEVAGHICRTAGDPLTGEEWEKYVPDLPPRPAC
jgi:WD40 repeat protein/transcriptional regulator with XRE-family HTH domain